MQVGQDGAGVGRGDRQPLGEPMRHRGLFDSAAFSPDGTRVVTASEDKTARVWDAATGKPLGEPMRHEDVVSLRRLQPRRHAGGHRELGQDGAGVGCGDGQAAGGADAA